MNAYLLALLEEIDAYNLTKHLPLWQDKCLEDRLERMVLARWLYRNGRGNPMTLGLEDIPEEDFDVNAGGGNALWVKHLPIPFEKIESGETYALEVVLGSGKFYLARCDYVNKRETKAMFRYRGGAINGNYLWITYPEDLG